MKKAVLALVTAATIGTTALMAASPALAWRGGWGWGPGLAGGLIAGAVIGGIASSAYAYGPGYGYYGGPGYGYYGGPAHGHYRGQVPACFGVGGQLERRTPTASTPPRTPTLPHTTADMDRVTALFAPHTHTTAVGTIAGIVTVGDR